MPDITSILLNITNNLTGIWHLITGGSYLAGFWFFVRGLYQLKQYGEMRSMMSSQTELKGPLLFLVVAAGLIFWPTVLNMMLITVYNSTNILSYSSSTGSEAGDLALSLAGGLIQLLGFIAFIRGWILLTTYGKQQQQSGLGKAVTHIIAGLLGVNIYATWDILKNTIGI